MSVEAKITQYLNDSGIEFRVIEHPAAGSAREYQATLGTRLEQQAKALFLRVKQPGRKSFAVAALQAHKQADLARLARLLNASEVRLATADQLQQVTGCRFGELPPFGAPFGVPLLVDNDLLKEPEIFFNVGDLERSMVLDPNALVTLETPITF